MGPLLEKLTASQIANKANVPAEIDYNKIQEMIQTELQASISRI